jgi:hypothetical protein
MLLHRHPQAEMQGAPRFGQLQHHPRATPLPEQLFAHALDREINVPEGDVLAQGYLDELIRLATTYSTATSNSRPPCAVNTLVEEYIKLEWSQDEREGKKQLKQLCEVDQWAREAEREGQGFHSKAKNARFVVLLVGALVPTLTGLNSAFPEWAEWWPQVNQLAVIALSIFGTVCSILSETMHFQDQGDAWSANGNTLRVLIRNFQHQSGEIFEPDWDSADDRTVTSMAEDDKPGAAIALPDVRGMPEDALEILRQRVVGVQTAIAEAKKQAEDALPPRRHNDTVNLFLAAVDRSDKLRDKRIGAADGA